MTNVVVRLYSYGGSHRVEDSIRIAAQDLAPQIMNIDGIFSYTLFKVDDGRFGSATLCSDDSAAHASTKAAVEWVSTASVMQHAELDAVIQGRSFFTYEGSGASATGMYGHLRIVRSQGSVDEWRRMAEQELKPLFGSELELIRLIIVETDQTDTYLIFGVFKDRNAFERLVEKVTAVQRQHGSALSRLVSAQPEDTDACIIETFVR